MNYHEPVMLDECIEGLDIQKDGIYVDVTFGGGGHSKAMLSFLENGKLYAFDQDSDAAEVAGSISDPSFVFIQANFRNLKRYLKLHGVVKIDGLLADLGVSSHQLDVAERGFSTRFDAELDMRMDREAQLTAKEVLNTYSEKELHKLFGLYGEVRNARNLASAIITNRANRPIHTVGQLKEILDTMAPKRREFKYYAQVFQAIRIEVNDEMKSLEELLVQSAELIRTGGRMVVMSYHSLEDRLVKNFIAKGKFYGESEKDFFGNVLKPFEAVTRKPVLASEDEIKRNNRARSAKLRVAKKI
jgi:16S rRNA (cytosine1402-N4)-methyltransferase